jgi:hypothetical protein
MLNYDVHLERESQNLPERLTVYRNDGQAICANPEGCGDRDCGDCAFWYQIIQKLASFARVMAYIQTLKGLCPRLTRIGGHYEKRKLSLLWL